jgi:hypothetical protein
VGEWVEEHATDALRERQRRVTSVERATIDLALDPATQTISERPLVQRPSVVSVLPPVVAAPPRLENPFDPPDLVNAGSGTSQAANLTVTSQSLPMPQGPGRHGWLVLAFMGILLVTAGGVWLWARGAPERAAGSRSASPLPELGVNPERPSRSPALPGGEPAAPHNGARDNGSRGVTTTPASDSTRNVDSPRGLDSSGGADSTRNVEPVAPDAGAEAPSSVVPQAAGGSQASKPADLVVKDRRARPAPKGGRARPRARPPKPAPPKKEPTVSNTEAKSGAECNPPYTVDSSGIRRLKPECLKE